MRITESRLRRLIRSVIKENLSDMHTNVVSKMSTIRNEKDFLKAVDNFIKNDTKIIKNIRWQNDGIKPERDLMHITCPPTTDGIDEHGQPCDFSVSKHAGEKTGSLSYKFTSEDESVALSFGVECYITPGYLSSEYDDDEPGDCVCKLKAGPSYSKWGLGD